MRIVDLMAYTTIFIWGVGAVLLILLGLHAVQWLAWRVFKEFMGWPKLYKIMRDYHERKRKEASNAG